MSRASIIIACALELTASRGLEAQTIAPEKVGKVNVRIVDTIDRFNGTRTIAAARLLNLDNTGLFTTLSLNPAAIAPQDGPPIFYILVTYTGYGWVFLDGRVQILADGNRYSAIGAPSSADRAVRTCSGSTGCIVEELMRIPLSREAATAIANARDAELRVTGSKGSVVGRLDHRHIAYFREIMRRYEEIGGTYLEASAPAAAAAATAQPGPEAPPASPPAACEYCKKMGLPPEN